MLTAHLPQSFSRLLHRPPAEDAHLPPAWQLDAPLIRFSKRDPWRVRDAFEGTQIFGATGSGKTSGSGRLLALNLLQHGFGGLVLTAKPDEAARWQAYAEHVGRGADVRLFQVGEQAAFNFLAYELAHAGRGESLTGNLVELFCTVVEASERRRQGAANEAYWERALRQLLRNAIDLVVLATGSLSLPELARVITSAPNSREEARDPQWQADSLCYQLMSQAQERVPPDDPRRGDLEVTISFWLEDFAGLAERTRSIVTNSFTSLCDGFLRSPMRELFCGETTLSPDDVLAGAVVIIDLPLKEYQETGRLAQVLWKHVFQRAVERRDSKAHPRPVFLWADEAHLFVTRHDAEFQSTARSSRCATVYLTQGLPNYHATLGGPSSGEAESLLANLSTKVFHANGDVTTNEWAQRLFASTWTTRGAFGSSSQRAADPLDGLVTTTSSNQQQSLDPQVIAHRFTTLKKGGPAAKFQVEGIVHQSGRVWKASQSTALPTVFTQK